MRDIEIFSEVKDLRVDRKKLCQLINLLDELYGPEHKGTLSIAFVSHQRLSLLHQEFCHDGRPTDIITFPADKNDPDNWGELCISPQAAKEWILRHGGSFGEEMKRYVIHGYLHLVGYDDLQPRLKAQMRRQEKQALERVTDAVEIFGWKNTQEAKKKKNAGRYRRSPSTHAGAAGR